MTSTANTDIGTPADDARQVCVRLWDAWTDLWNGELGLGPQILTDDFRVGFGSATAAADGADDLVGGAATAGYIGAFRERYASLRYRTDVGPVVDADGTRPGHLACRWVADVVDRDGTTRQVAGHDILRVRGDLIDHAWSVTGARNLLDG
ncbi:MAG TPA: hypothetical protein VGN37_19100 [Actinocatenispora sp.]